MGAVFIIQQRGKRFFRAVKTDICLHFEYVLNYSSGRIRVVQVGALPPERIVEFVDWLEEIDKEG